MRVVVVGGGIAGLAAAHRLRELAPDGEIVVVERSGALGGRIRTGTILGRPVESGAETFLVRDAGAESAAWRLAHRVGLGDALAHPAPVPAAIHTSEGLRPLQGGTLLGIPAQAPAGVAAAGLDRDDGRPLLAPGADIEVGRLVRERFGGIGDEVVDRLVEPMLGGVYAGRADRLSLAATIPGLHAAAQRHPTLTAAVRAALAAAGRPPGAPVFATVVGGMSRLVAATAAAATRLRLGEPVRGLARTGDGWRLLVGSRRDAEALLADAVVLAVPATPAARLLAGVDAQTAALVGALDYASVALVTLALPAGTPLPELSGFLVPPGHGYAVKAATFFTTKWPHLRDPGGPVLVRASVGRHREEAELQRTDADLVALVRAELGELVGLRAGGLPEPMVSAVTRWGGALPQYAVGHVDRIAAARARLDPTLALAGAAFDGIGIAACVRSGVAAADAIWGHLSQLPA